MIRTWTRDSLDVFMKEKTNTLSSLVTEGIERSYPTASKEAGMDGCRLTWTYL